MEHLDLGVNEYQEGRRRARLDYTYQAVSCFYDG
jgi:hypothetical protein